METIFRPEKTHPRPSCLNRTMQYGNLTGIKAKQWLTHGFKSYYVVWKPERWKEIDEGKDV